MTKMLLSLSDPLGKWAERKAVDKKFDSVNDYIESLLLREQEDEASLAEFDRLIQEGEDSGISERSMDEIIADARRQARERFDAKL